MTTPGYYTSVWPAEDGGADRSQTPTGVPGPGYEPGEALEVVSRDDVFAATMLVTREPGEVFLLRHTMGGDTVAVVERVDAETLGTVEISPELAAGPFWPGGLAAHRNGYLYVVYGRWCHKLSADCELVVSRQLPAERPYNSFVVLADGHLVMKDFIKGDSGPSTLCVLEPDSLEHSCEPLELPEGSIARLSADGDTVYVQGSTTAYRYRWDGASLITDNEWGARYLLAADQSYAWDATISGGGVWFMDNGDHDYQGTMRGAGLATGPVHLVRIPVAGGPVEMAEISGLPHGTQTNLPAFDPERRLAVAYDSGNGVLACWRTDIESSWEPLWRKNLGAAMHMIRFPDSGELVVNDYSAEFGDSVVVLSIETGEERTRVVTGSSIQSVLFPAVGFERDLYYCSFGTIARIHPS